MGEHLNLAVAVGVLPVLLSLPEAFSAAFCDDQCLGNFLVTGRCSADEGCFPLPDANGCGPRENATFRDLMSARHSCLPLREALCENSSECRWVVLNYASDSSLPPPLSNYTLLLCVAIPLVCIHAMACVSCLGIWQRQARRWNDHRDGGDEVEVGEQHHQRTINPDSWVVVMQPGGDLDVGIEMVEVELRHVPGAEGCDGLQGPAECRSPEAATAQSGSGGGWNEQQQQEEEEEDAHHRVDDAAEVLQADVREGPESG